MCGGGSAPPVSGKKDLGYAPGAGSAPVSKAVHYQVERVPVDKDPIAVGSMGEARTRGIARWKDEAYPAGRSHRHTSGGKAVAWKTCNLGQQMS
jgi:hypothetical protein